MFFFRAKDHRWSHLSRWPALALSLVWVLNAIVLVQTLFWAHDERALSRAQKHVPSISYLSFYAFSMLALTTIQPLVDLTLLRAGLLHPVLALTTASVFLAGWTAQLGLWFACEATPRSVDSHEVSVCPTAVVAGRRAGAIKAYLGLLIATAFTVYLGLAIHVLRRSRQRACFEEVEPLACGVEDYEAEKWDAAVFRD